MNDPADAASRPEPPDPASSEGGPSAAGPLSRPGRIATRIRDILHGIGEHRTVVALAAILSVLTGLWWAGERAGLWGGGAPPPDLVDAAVARLLADERAKADAETIKALRAAVEALARQRGPGVEEALDALARGDRTRAEALFAEIGARRAAEGAAANREAAEPFRHLGALAFLDDTAGSLAAYRRAAELDPSDVWTWIFIARLEQRAGDLAAAEEAARRAMEAAERARSDRDRMAALNTLGDILVARGERIAALAAYRAGLAIAEALAKKDPGNAAWQRDLSLSHDRIGDVLLAQGDRAGALAAYRAGLAIAEALAAKDPGNTLWQRDLIVSNVKLAQMAEQAGNRAEARRRYAEALRIATALQEAGRLTPVDAWMVPELLRLLAAL